MSGKPNKSGGTKRIVKHEKTFSVPRVPPNPDSVYLDYADVDCPEEVVLPGDVETDDSALVSPLHASTKLSIDEDDGKKTSEKSSPVRPKTKKPDDDSDPPEPLLTPTSPKEKDDSNGKSDEHGRHEFPKVLWPRTDRPPVEFSRQGFRIFSSKL